MPNRSHQIVSAASSSGVVANGETIPCDAVNEYIYDPTNETGSYRWIKANASLTDEGEKEYYFFVFLSSDVVENLWKTSVKNVLASKYLSSWLEDQQKTLGVDLNEKALKKF